MNSALSNEVSQINVQMFMIIYFLTALARSTGANQAVDQVKVFGDRVRWFRDIPPPSDEVPISVGLSDVNHAVSVALDMMGPVHLNIQLRENLAPEGGLIRGDSRVDSVETFNLQRFSDVPGFEKWAYGASPFQVAFMNSPSTMAVDVHAVRAVTRTLKKSRRALIVVGNVRHKDDDVYSIISHVAMSWGIPIFADVQSGILRESSATVAFVDHILKCPSVLDNLQPDLILQIGHPLISTEVQKLIESTMKSQRKNGFQPAHILLHPHHSNERSNPLFTVTHRISCNVGAFLVALRDEVVNTKSVIHSELAPIVELGRHMKAIMPDIIHEASKNVCNRLELIDHGDKLPLTEPQVVLAINDILSNYSASSLFLSNSMPVRDGDAFLYPLYEDSRSPKNVAVNRGKAKLYV